MGLLQFLATLLGVVRVFIDWRAKGDAARLALAAAAIDKVKDASDAQLEIGLVVGNDAYRDPDGYWMRRAAPRPDAGD